jgi:hypothetical protein
MFKNRLADESLPFHSLHSAEIFNIMGMLNVFFLYNALTNSEEIKKKISGGKGSTCMTNLQITEMYVAKDYLASSYNGRAESQYSVVWLHSPQHFQIKSTNLFWVRKLGVFNPNKHMHFLYFKKFPFL